MRKAGKVDANQGQIVNAIRRVGATVTITSSLGQGFPDLVVGYKKTNYLFEIKDGSQPPSRQKLTPDEEEWHAAWRGSVHIIASVDDAFAVLGIGFRHRYQKDVLKHTYGPVIGLRRVYHNDFGFGIVINEDDEMISVQFPDWGTKVFEATDNGLKEV